MRTEIYRDASGFAALTGEWNALLRRSRANTVFLTHEYQRIWWRHLGKGDLCLVAVRDDEDALTGIAALFGCAERDPLTLTFVGCVDVSDYLDWIAVEGRESEVYSAILEALSGPDVPPWAALDLCNIPQGSPLLEYLPALAYARGWGVEQSVMDVCPVIRLPSSFEDYLAGLDKKERHELRRKLRRAEQAEGITWRLASSGHDGAPAEQRAALDEVEVDRFLDLMAFGDPDKTSFLTPARRAFFRDLARVTHTAGWLQLAFLEHRPISHPSGAVQIAAYFNFYYGGRIMVYNSGLNPQGYHWLSPGIVLLGRLIEDAIRQGRSEFDFLRGDEDYKYRLGGVDTTVHRLLVIR